MDNKFDPQQFTSKLISVLKTHSVPTCPFCGGNEFTSTNEFASITINNSFENIVIGQSIPAGMVICTKCGHIEFFALGALGLLPKKEEDNNEQK